MTTPTMADRFEVYYRANAPLMTPRPTHLDLMTAYFAGANELVLLLGEARSLDDDQVYDDTQARLLTEIFAFAHRMASQRLTQFSNEGADDVQLE